MQTEENPENRRPLKVRGRQISRDTAAWLNNREITPNQISVISVLFAGAAAMCLFIWPSASGVWMFVLPVLGAVFIQLRLLCNLFDGMVAIEGGKATASGELFNEIPDRIADPLILVSVGYAINVTTYGSSLGWFAALLSVLTAYVRALSCLAGAPADFKGPMAKQHRMALVTLACLAAACEMYIRQSNYTLLVALVIIIIGSLITVCRRTVSSYRFLENKK